MQVPDPKSHELLKQYQNSLASLLPASPELDRRIERVVEQILDANDATHLASLGSVVAHFPHLQRRWVSPNKLKAPRPKLKREFSWWPD